MKGVRTIGIYAAGVGAVGYLLSFVVSQIKPYDKILGLVIVGGVALFIIGTIF